MPIPRTRGTVIDPSVSEFGYFIIKVTDIFSGESNYGADNLDSFIETNQEGELGVSTTVLLETLV